MKLLNASSLHCLIVIGALLAVPVEDLADLAEAGAEDSAAADSGADDEINAWNVPI